MRADNKNPLVSISQASALCGLSIHMLTYLGRIDVLKPSVGGRGRERQYSFNDVLFLKVIADLLRRGIEVKRLGPALQHARAEASLWVDIRRKPRHYLVTDGTDLFVRNKGQLEAKNGQFAFAFVLDLTPVHKAVAAAWPEHSRRMGKRASR